MLHYQKIKDYITHLKANFKLEVTFKDFCGFISLDNDLDNILRPYTAHTNPYCLFVKDSQRGYMRCIKQKTCVYEKCKEGQSFIGYCHAGVGELVIPIMKDNLLFGAITIAHFSHDVKRANHLVELAFKYDSDERKITAKELYTEFMNISSIDISTLLFSVELLAEYLSEVASLQINKSNCIVYARNSEISTNHNINAMDHYFNDNYMNKLTISDLAKHLSCTNRDTSELIKKTKNMNFNSYLNFIRIDASKKLLMTTSHDLEKISQLVGFSNQYYFIRIFTNTIGISPSKFIEYYKYEKMI